MSLEKTYERDYLKCARCSGSRPEHALLVIYPSAETVCRDEKICADILAATKRLNAKRGAKRGG